MKNFYYCEMPVDEAAVVSSLYPFSEILHGKEIDDESLENEIDRAERLLMFSGSSALSEWNTFFCRLSIGEADQWLYYYDASHEADEIFLIGVGAHTNETSIAMFLRLVIEQNMVMPGSITLLENFAVKKLDLLDGWRGAGHYADDPDGRAFAEDFKECRFS